MKKGTNFSLHLTDFHIYREIMLLLSEHFYKFFHHFSKCMCITNLPQPTIGTPSSSSQPPHSSIQVSYTPDSPDSILSTMSFNSFFTPACRSHSLALNLSLSEIFKCVIIPRKKTFCVKNNNDQ